MKRIDKEIDLEKLARLARIQISKKDKKRITKDILEIINYFNKINELKIGLSYKFFHQSALENVWREDIPKNFEANAILDQVPNKKGRYLRSPKIG